MNSGCSQLVPGRVRTSAAAALALLLGGCFGPDLDAGTQTLAGPDVSPERRAALVEMRQKSEAVDAMPFDEEGQAAQMARLAARQEPRPASDVAAIEAELTAIAQLQRAANTPEEIAELQARAAALRLKSIEDRAGRLRQ